MNTPPYPPSVNFAGASFVHCHEYENQDSIRTGFYEVVWKASEVSEMAFVSDPFATTISDVEFRESRNRRFSPSNCWSACPRGD